MLPRTTTEVETKGSGPEGLTGFFPGGFNSTQYGHRIILLDFKSMSALLKIVVSVWQGANSQRTNCDRKFF